MSEAIQVLKFLFVVDAEAGKSCIILRFADDTFSSCYLSTIGVDFRIKTIPISGQQVKLQIWDTAGQQRFRTITSSYYRGAHAIMFVYDVSRRSSFQAIKNNWLGEVRTHGNESVVTMLIGTKADLIEEREVSYQEGRDLANQLEIDFLQVSGKTNQNIDEAFRKLAQRFLCKMRK